ncbi:hypothetical protein AALP_AA6G149200 [Arabis alpina]|uniref:MATH domain-containing protein n=1 Tax=Arabis alpina TaxID=50452 RepID=A0A087GPA9_ARAAL|nr:hypothetical protein AALP_AA6G149200 [Arabis alpina]
MFQLLHANASSCSANEDHRSEMSETFSEKCPKLREQKHQMTTMMIVSYTWIIENFSQTNNEIRSNVFEVGNYKWYLLLYPQGCDGVTNHLSVFVSLRLAQYTIALVNKDPKKSKHSDTIHQFWKYEHDWGWKKFIELTKLQDGFIDDYDSLIIKAQVQVIRENVDRPFRCLDDRYMKEFLCVYSTNVKHSFLRFVEEKRSKLVTLKDDKKRWESLCNFWLGMDQKTKLEMSREKMDVILKLVVKQFLIEKEVTSTLVTEFLFYGLKSIEEKKRLLHKLSQLVEETLLLDDKNPLDNRSKNLEDETNTTKKQAICDSQ